MPSVHRVKHEVKYSNGTFEIPMLEEERDRQDKTITRVGFTVRNCLLLVSRAQTTICSQGVYCFQYKRLRALILKAINAL